MRVAHRMMRVDLVRRCSTAGAIAAGRSACSDRRAAALARRIRLLGVEIHHPCHDRRIEDDGAWPVVVAHAEAQVDLAVLSDDRAPSHP